MAPQITTELTDNGTPEDLRLGENETVGCITSSSPSSLATMATPDFATHEIVLKSNQEKTGFRATNDNKDGKKITKRKPTHVGPDDPHTQSPDVDGGWAWVVFAAGFLQFLVSSGMFYSFSIFFVEFLQTFDESRAKTGWVYSTNSAIHMFSGPLGGFVIVRWGPRTAILLGGFLAALGYFLTAFAPSLNVVFITYSFINAVGTSLNFSGWVVGLSKFWNRHHALIVGIAMSGSGCGMFILGPLMTDIVVEYGWRGAMLICSGLSLNFCVFGATIYNNLRPPQLDSGGQLNEELLSLDGVKNNDHTIEFPKDSHSLYVDERRMNDYTVGSVVNLEGEKYCSEAPALTSKIILGSSWSLNGSSFVDNLWEKLQHFLRSLKTSIPCRKNSSISNQINNTEHECDSVSQLLRSPKFWLLEASCFLSFMATTILYAVFLDWTHWRGLSASFPIALAGSGAGDLIGRLFAGFLMGKRLPPLILFSGIQLLLAATIGCAGLATTGVHLISCMVGFGVACGLQSVLYALMPSQLSSGVNMAKVLGYLLLVTGAGALTGPPVAGLLVDLTESYDSVMILCTVAPAAAAVFSLTAHFISRRHHTETNYSLPSEQCKS